LGPEFQNYAWISARDTACTLAGKQIGWLFSFSAAPNVGSKLTLKLLRCYGLNSNEKSERHKMAPTRSFGETIKEQLADPKFRREFLREAVSCMIAGDLETAKSALREYVNGTVGFVALGEAVSKSPKSLMRMLSPSGNPQARNLFQVLVYLQEQEGTTLEVTARRQAAA
jgi:hypothetical protein